MRGVDSHDALPCVVDLSLKTVQLTGTPHHAIDPLFILSLDGAA